MVIDNPDKGSVERKGMTTFKFQMNPIWNRRLHPGVREGRPHRYSNSEFHAMRMQVLAIIHFIMGTLK